MDSRDRQYIGTLAKDEYTDRSNVFVNRMSAIQYKIKSLMLPIESDIELMGYISSFEEADITDDEYLNVEQRTENFIKAVNDKLFIYCSKPALSGEYPKAQKIYLVDRPRSYDNNTRFYSVPVFAPAYDDVIKAWEEDRRWKLYRDFNSFDEFKGMVKAQKPVGSIYGYSPEVFSPSFVIWKDDDGKLWAIGKIMESRLNTLGGMVLSSEELFSSINISDYAQFVVYRLDINPTIMFIPEEIYRKIEEEILKASVNKGTMIQEQHETLPLQEEMLEDFAEEEEHSEKIEIFTKNEDVVEIHEPVKGELDEIDTSIKNDELIIKAMDYHSQRRNLYYSYEDFINVHTAIKCSNLIILSGLSGTGKSAMVDVYARALGINPTISPEENRLLFIPVRPSWNDDADLLGYVDLVHMVYRASDTGFVDFLIRAQNDKNRMFIVCFDEMNLARVEHYFSQFLSILEKPEPSQRELQLYDDQYSGRLYNSAAYPSRIQIGNNVRFIGTVNVDESTYHFSDKVLDRANVIQLEVLNYAEKWIKKNYGTLGTINWSYEDYNKIIVKTFDSNMSEIQSLLWELHLLLQSASAKYGIGPRIVKCIIMYIQNLPSPSIGHFDQRLGLDYQIAQRVLTKVRGPENQLGDILNEDSEINFSKIFDKYKKLSDFTKCRSIVSQKKKELETYGYCI